MSSAELSVCDCEGWWEQEVYGRQPMEDLQLTFAGGRIHGSGIDIIAPFTFSGTITEKGAVAMRKQYLRMHSVDYLGIYDGEGILSGERRIGPCRGPWLIRIRRLAQASEAAIAEFVPVAARDCPPSKLEPAERLG